MGSTETRLPDIGEAWVSPEGFWPADPWPKVEWEKVYGASEVRQKLVDVIEKSERELLRNWPNIQSALPPEEPVAAPIVVEG